MKLVVFSICKDEAETIGKVLDGIPANIPGIKTIEKWVIDDGSSDKTAYIAEKHGAHVVSDGASKRLAFRFREALEIALDRGADIMVNIDGDMQFNPADIPKLVQPVVKGEADFVAADRFTSASTGRRRRPTGMPVVKYLGNKMGAKIIGMLSQSRFNDVTCGFRAYGPKALVALNINGTYTYTQESFQVLAMKKLRIMAIPVPVKYYPGRKSRVVTNILKFVGQSAINILRSYRDFAPLRFFGLLGLLPFIFGLACSGFFFAHWIITGSLSPYKFLGFTGLYLVTLGILFWALGLVADMLSRMLNNQEKILEKTKEIRLEQIKRG